MSRLLFLAAIVAVVYLLLKSYRSRLPQGEQPPARTENMVRCSYCGVHLPKSEAIAAGDKYYCGEAHRRADQPPSADQNGG